MSTVELPAEMHCRSCEQRVIRTLRSVEGVRFVEADLKRQRVTVELNERVIGAADLRIRVENAVAHPLPEG